MYQALSAIVWGVKDVTHSRVLGLLGVGKALRRKIVSFGEEQTLSSINVNLSLKVVVRQMSLNSVVLKYPE